MSWIDMLELLSVDKKCALMITSYITKSTNKIIREKKKQKQKSNQQNSVQYFPIFKSKVVRSTNKTQIGINKYQISKCIIAPVWKSADQHTQIPKSENLWITKLGIRQIQNTKIGACKPVNGKCTILNVLVGYTLLHNGGMGFNPVCFLKSR